MQLTPVVGNSNPVGSITLGITTGKYVLDPANVVGTMGTPSTTTPHTGYVTVGQNPVGTIMAGTWFFNMTLQDTAAGGTANVWMTVFSCNQQDIGRPAPAAPVCTFLFKLWDNSTNIKATTDPKWYSYSKSLAQFTGVQVLYVEYWVSYTVSGGSPNDIVTFSTGYAANSGSNLGFSVQTPSATYWLGTPDLGCVNTCGTLSTSTGAASTGTSVTMTAPASPAKYYVRPTVAGSTSTGTPHFLGGTVISSGWLVLDNGFLGTSIAAGTWGVNLRAQTSFATNPITVDGHAVSPTGSSVCAPSAGGTCTISATTTLTNDVVVLFVDCNPPGTLGTVTITDGNSLTWNSRVAWQQIGGRSQGEWWAVSAGALSSDTVTATFSAAQTSCNLLYISINGANTATPYDTNAAEPATVNANSPATCTMSTNSADVILFGQVGQGGTPAFTAPAGWTPGDTGGAFEKFDAWHIVPGAVSSQAETWTATAGSNISGLCDAIVASIATPGTANFWVTIFSCNVPNLGQGQIILTPAGGQAAQTCSPIVKNWDNTTNILSTAWTTYSYSFSGVAFGNAKYLYMEVWISHTGASGSAPTVAFTIQDSSSSVAIPAGSTYYLTAQQTTCSTPCENLFYYDGTQSLATTVNDATNTGDYQVRPGLASATRGTPSTSIPDGYAWIPEGQINSTVQSGTWKFVMSLTDSAPGDTVYLWFTVWNCLRPNIGQPGAGCTFMFKNWDNTTSIGAASFGTYTYLTAAEPVFASVKYLAIEIWMSETVVSGSSPDVTTFHLGDTESFVSLPGGQNVFYYTNTAMTCTIGCRFFSTSTGAADSNTKVTVGAAGSLTFEVRPYVTSSVSAVISTTTVIGSGWETPTPMDANITAGPWKFNVTVSNTVASGTGYLWFKVYSCPDSVAASPPNCVFLFNNYDNSTNLLAQVASKLYSFTTTSQPLFHNVQYLYIEYWLRYSVAGTGDTITFVTVSAASSVQTPPTTGAGLTGLRVDSGKVIDTTPGAGIQQLRVSTANKNSLVYVTVSLAFTTIGIVFLKDNANLTWHTRSVKIGASEILYAFYAIAKPILQGDVISTGSGVAVQQPMAVTIVSGANTAAPFDSFGSLVATTQTRFLAPACTSSSCPLAFLTGVAKGNLLVGALAYSVPSATCNTFTTASDTLSSTFTIENTASVVSGGSCFESVIVGGYAGGSGADTITISFSGGVTPGNVGGEVFELLGVSTSLGGTAIGSGTGTSVSTSTSLSYHTNDFLVATFAGSAATSLTAGGGFTVFSSSRSSGEYQSAIAPGSTNFPMTAGSSNTWSEAAVVFKAATPSQPSATAATSSTPNVALTTTHSDDIVIGAVDAHTITAPTAGPGFTLLAVPVVAPSTVTMGTEYARFFSPKTLLAVNFTLSSSVAWIMMGDAVHPLTVSRLPSDTFTVSDSPASMASLPRSSADAWSSTEGASRVVVVPRAVSDSSPFSDLAARLLAFGRPGADSYAFVESALSKLQFTRTASDTFSFSEFAARLVQAPRSVGDSFAFLDVASRAGAFTRGIADAFSFFESAVSNVVLARLSSDSYVFTDAADRLVQLARGAADPFTFSDSVSSLLSLGRGVSDPFSFSDVVARLLALSRTAGDTFPFSDLPSGVSSFGRGVADTFSFLETVLRNLQFTRAASDSFSISEIADRLAQLARFPLDAFPFSETPNQLKHFGFLIRDVFAFGDGAARVLALIRNAVDTFLFTDSVLRALNFVRGLADRFAVGAMALVLVALSVAINDVFRIIDTVLSTLRTVVETTTTPGGGFVGRYDAIIFFFLPLLILLLILLILLATYLKRRRKGEAASG